MTLLYAFVGAATVGCAAYMILSRNLVRMLLGFSLLATGLNLLLFLAGGVHSEQPPIIGHGEKTLRDSADPLTQALILTAIVISFALTVVLATLVLRAWRGMHSIDARRADAAEALGAPPAAEAEND